MKIKQSAKRKFHQLINSKSNILLKKLIINLKNNSKNHQNQL